MASQSREVSVLFAGRPKRTGICTLVAMLSATLAILAIPVSGYSGTPQDEMQGEMQDEMLGMMSAEESADDTAAKLTPEQERFFETKIRPALVTNCYSCHSHQSGRSEGGLDVDSAAGLLSGGDSGPAIDLEDYTAGMLWKAINYDGLEIPPLNPLPAHVIEDFRVWLEAGAPDPRVTKVVRGAYKVTPEAIEKGREFWSLQKLPRSSTDVLQESVESHANGPASSKPIDQFVEIARRQHEVTTPPSADGHTVFRRLCLDLLGVPPTAEQVDWFQQMWTANPETAVATAVDYMLDSPKFGERWGRHWLDIVRYAESTGREVNMPYPQAWRYRDYVIDSFNNDKPYDRFLKEQLVGDLLPSRNRQQKQEQLIATGFLALGPKTLNERSARQFAADVIDEQIDVTTRAILGISVACARCHDHKFEAITQQDYYALAGIFGNMSTHYGGVNSQRNRHTSTLIELPITDQQPAMSAVSTAQLQSLKDSIAELQTEVRDLRRQNVQANRPNRNRPANNSNSNANDSEMNRRGMEQQQRQQMVQRLTTQIGSLQGLVDCYNSDGTPRSLCMGVQPKPRSTDARLLERGEANLPGEVVPRGFVKLLDQNPPRIRRDSSGRMEFANWVASPKNPLTARVMANRVWQHLIGEGIVRTPEDFGVTGSRPSHPELLDYLATRLIENNWSIKSLIREIATSDTYRIGWQVDVVSREKDPDNNYLWRSHPRRLEAEVLRDSLLWVGGSLEVERPTGSLVAQAGPLEIGRGQQLAQLMRATAMNNMGSRSMEGGAMAGGAMAGEMMDSMERASNDNRQNNNRQNNNRQTDRRNIRRDFSMLNSTTINEASVNRDFQYRSVYLPIVRDLLPRSLDLFDVAEPSMVIGVREQSNTATQALFMMNNDLVRQQSMNLAERVLEQTASDSQAIQYIFKSSYSRPATAEEEQKCQQFLAELTERFQADALAKAAQSAENPRRRQRREAAERMTQRGGRGGRNTATRPADQETDTRAEAEGAVISAEVQRQVMIVFCHSILATAEFRYRN